MALTILPGIVLDSKRKQKQSANGRGESVTYTLEQHEKEEAREESTSIRGQDRPLAMSYS